MALYIVAAANNPDGIEEQVEYFEHVPQSPDLSLGLDNTRILRYFDIPGPSLPDAMRLILGYSRVQTTVVAGVTTRFIARLTPMQDTQFPGLFATSARVVAATERPINAPLGVPHAIYDKFRLAVQFETLTYRPLSDSQFIAQTSFQVNVLGLVVNFPVAEYADEGRGAQLGRDRYLTILAEPKGRFITLPTGLMRFVGDAKPVPEGLQVARPDQVIEIMWHQVPAVALPRDFHAYALGGINESAFLGIPFNTSKEFQGYPARTLCITAIGYRPRMNALRQRVYDVRIQMVYRPNLDRTVNPPVPRGWNFYERVVGGILTPVELSSNGQAGGSKPYHDVDFAKLFRPDA